jgi:CRISPR/Cas system-associated exonuclease Cas4 (RecB family)
MPLEKPPRSSATITSTSPALAIEAVSPDSIAATKSATPAQSPEEGTLSSNDAAEGEALSDSDGVAEPAAKKVKISGRNASEWAYYFFLHEVKGRKKMTCKSCFMSALTEE